MSFDTCKSDDNGVQTEDLPTLSDLRVVPHFPENIHLLGEFIKALISDGYQAKFAYFVAIYYVLYHRNGGYTVPGTIAFEDIEYFHSYCQTHPYFVDLYQEQPELLGYFLSQETIYPCGYGVVSDDEGGE